MEVIAVAVATEVVAVPTISLAAAVPAAAVIDLR